MNREVCLHGRLLSDQCELCDNENYASNAALPKNASYWKRRCLKAEQELGDLWAAYRRLEEVSYETRRR